MGKYEVARRAVFLDSDRVFNRAFVRDGHPYPPSSVEDFEVHDRAAPGCARLKAANFLLVVITNQADVGRGKQSRETVEAMHLKMQSALPFLWHDVDCARAAGCRAIFIQRGYEESLREVAEFTVPNFNDAVNALLRDVCL